MNSYSGKEISFSEIEGFPSVNIKGHPGLFKLTEKAVLMAGRIHFYEGHSIEDVILPVALLWKMGVEKIVLTNAAGGVKQEFCSRRPCSPDRSYKPDRPEPAYRAE